MNAIEIKDLKKTYKSKFSSQEKEALKGINLEIPQGSFFGLLGPNGAGKSTLISIIAGLTIKTSGSVSVNGLDLDTDAANIRRSIGIVPQEVVIDPFFPVRKTLEYYAGYFGVKKAERKTDEILKALNLYDKADVNPRRLSGGMKRRFLIAKALVNSPKILILDEPTAGVDVELRLQLWNYVTKLNKEEGTTILLTTHYLEEAEELCDQIAIINHGEVIANDTTENLIHTLGQKNIIFKIKNGLTAIPDSLREFSPEIINGDSLKVAHNRNDSKLEEIIAKIKQNGLEINDISSTETDLEDVFRKLVNG